MAGRGPTRQRASSIEKAAERLAQLSRLRIGGAPQRDGEAIPPEPAEGAPSPDLPAPVAASPRTSRKVSIDLEAMRLSGMVTVSSERSVIAEEFRLIKRPLLAKVFATGQDKIRHGNLIMVSSARPGEGKTFCAVNLAMSIALERDLTVMLVDADVAKPSIADTLGFEADRGLIDLIADDGLDLADVLVRTDIDKLTVLPAGRPRRHFRFPAGTDEQRSRRPGNLCRPDRIRCTGRKKLRVLGRCGARADQQLQGRCARA
jgi:Mrp family chromosome partitioning ATPase